MQGVVLFAVLLGLFVGLVVYAAQSADNKDYQTCQKLAKVTNEGIPVTVGRWICIGEKKAQ